jgi:hypothetical protein
MAGKWPPVSTVYAVIIRTLIYKEDADATQLFLHGED